MIRSALRLNYLFGSKHSSHEAAGAHHTPAHNHHHHNQDQLPHYEHDPHNLGRQTYVIEGTEPIDNLAKKWLRFMGWEPDTPRSRIESPHFNEHLNIPITHEKPNSLYRYMTYLPTSLFRFFVQNAEESISRADRKELNSDYIVPAEINEPNSVFVYESFMEGNALKKFRSLQALILPVGLLLGNYPVVNAVAIAVGYFTFHPRVYIPSKVLVRRLDILPDKKQLRVERVTWFGRERIEYMDIEDIVYAEQSDPVFDSHGFWDQNRHYADRYLVFRNKRTNSVLIFDRDGVWSEEGLKHELIH